MSESCGHVFAFLTFLSDFNQAYLRLAQRPMYIRKHVALRFVKCYNFYLSDFKEKETKRDQRRQFFNGCSLKARQVKIKGYTYLEAAYMRRGMTFHQNDMSCLSEILFISGLYEKSVVPE